MTETVRPKGMEYVSSQTGMNPQGLFLREMFRAASDE